MNEEFECSMCDKISTDEAEFETAIDQELEKEEYICEDCYDDMSAEP